MRNAALMRTITVNFKCITELNCSLITFDQKLYWWNIRSIQIFRFLLYVYKCLSFFKNVHTLQDLFIFFSKNTKFKLYSNWELSFIERYGVKRIEWKMSNSNFIRKSSPSNWTIYNSSLITNKVNIEGKTPESRISFAVFQNLSSFLIFLRRKNQRYSLQFS